jgi:hypothetical protein
MRGTIGDPVPALVRAAVQDERAVKINAEHTRIVACEEEASTRKEKWGRWLAEVKAGQLWEYLIRRSYGV